MCCPDWLAPTAERDEVADATVKCFLRAVLLLFRRLRSCRRSIAELASARLNAMNNRFKSLPWAVHSPFLAPSSNLRWISGRAG